MDDTDKRLLDIVQGEFPLTSEPYREIASLLGVSEEEVILRLKRLKDEEIIRRTGAIFDSKKLGYCSTLCAMKVPPQRVDEVAQIVNEYPGVTHNYLRDVLESRKAGKPDNQTAGFPAFRLSGSPALQYPVYNMWFTITASSRRELDKIMAEIRKKSGIHDLIDLPAVRMFKIRVRFQMADAEKTQDGGDKGTPPVPPSPHPPVPIWVSSLEKRIVKELQEDIPLCHRPFKSIADEIGIEEAELLTKLRELKDRGIIRRFSAVLHHRNVGIRANAMAVWCVPADKAEEVGVKMAAFPQVSHCYQRVTRSGWPYNIYTMIHGKTVEDCELVAKTIHQDTGIEDYRLLYSTQELKKISMRYFTEKDWSGQQPLPDGRGLPLRPKRGSKPPVDQP